MAPKKQGRQWDVYVEECDQSSHNAIGDGHVFSVRQQSHSRSTYKYARAQ